MTGIEYSAWKEARGRCHNPNHKDYANYGGRGIVMCIAWRNSFAAFLADMGCKPSFNHSLDRIKNGGNYEPGNCKWSTRIEQQNNRRSNVVLTHNGESLTMAQWAKRLGVSKDVIRKRLKRGWSVEKTVTTRKIKQHYYIGKSNDKHSS